MSVLNRSDRADPSGQEAVAAYPLIEALIRRRSRRFALGNRLQGDGLSYESTAKPVPLSLEEEAILAFAGAGVTGHALGELPYQPTAGPETGGGQVMVTMLGRTFSSADAAATSALFINRDDATYMMRKPQDFARAEFDEIASLAQQGRFTELYERGRIRIADHRSEIPREVPYTPPFNKWSTNLPGATYFVPVTDVTALYLTVLFAALGEQFAYFFHDDRDWLVRPAGIARFGRSKGGFLHDDVHDGRVGTIDEIETYMLELCAFEQGLMLQNLMLTSEAIGLGGFPHYGAHRFAWPQAFGFTMKDRTFAEVLHQGFFGTLLMRLLRKNVTIPQAVGLERDGTVDHQAVRTALLPVDGGRGPGVRREQVHAGDGHLPGRPRVERVARPGGHPGEHPAVHGGERRGGHRVLRVRLQALRPVPGQLRPDPDRDGLPGPPRRHRVLRPLLSTGHVHRDRRRAPRQVAPRPAGLSPGRPSPG